MWKLSTIEAAAFKKKTIKEGAQDESQYLRFLMCDSSIDHGEQGMGTANELANLGQSRWKWKGMQVCATETGGKTWTGYE